MTYFIDRSSRAGRGAASLTTGRVALAAAAALGLAGESSRANPHDAEIKAFASTMAIARTARESCPGVEPDERFLEALRLRLHVVEADHPTFAPEAHAAADVLKRGLAEAPNREVWCAAVLRLYGPQGTLMRGMLRRE